MNVYPRLPIAALCLLFGCNTSPESYDPQAPSRGPGQYAGRDDPLNKTFAGGASEDTPPRELGEDEAPDPTFCDAACRAHCEAQAFRNPVDEGVCHRLWGAGFDTRPIHDAQACRRLHADLTGRFPSRREAKRDCIGRPHGDVARELIDSDAFVLRNQRLWADRMGYNNTVVNFERIYDADDAVQKAYGGRLRYDELAAVMSAHPVLTRRFDNAGDRVEALFSTFLGRPPFANERADMAKLYALWSNDYFEHPDLGLRLPDAFIEHACVDAETSGACTSVLWGYHELILEPDYRAQQGRTWCEVLTPEEWELLQLPGRILSTLPAFWEHAASVVLQQYLDYDIAALAPSVLQRMVEYAFEHGGDIRALHYAVVTSQVYLQSSQCGGDRCAGQDDAPPYVYGPMKQADAEVWLDTLEVATGHELGDCDHRLPETDALVRNAGPAGHELLEASRWTLDDEGRLDTRYRDLAQTLGGCPDNQTAGRFKAVSILNTATQERFVLGLCNPGMNESEGADIAALLPKKMDPALALNATVAEDVVRHQVGTFFGRGAHNAEVEMAQRGAEACVPKPCTAESFARPLCYALLSSSEMLFY